MKMVHQVLTLFRKRMDLKSELSASNTFVRTAVQKAFCHLNPDSPRISNLDFMG